MQAKDIYKHGPTREHIKNKNHNGNRRRYQQNIKYSTLGF